MLSRDLKLKSAVPKTWSTEYGVLKKKIERIKETFKRNEI